MYDSQSPRRTIHSFLLGTMADLGEVRKEHRFNEENLNSYLKINLQGYPKSSGKLVVKQYRSGQSNPTYYINKHGFDAVLRKKPSGPLLPGAHRVDREFRILSALHRVSFPVPRPLLYCSDTSVIGTEFYIMEHVKGRIFRGPSLDDLSPINRSKVYKELMKTLAKLHSVDWQALGLSDYGKHRKYLERQVATWGKQYHAASTGSNPSMEKLEHLLKLNVPEDNLKTVHGDYRIDNIIFHPSKCEIVAVLDWELSTLGHPVCDLAYTCLPYYNPEAFTPGGPLNQNLKGIPSVEECILMYSKSSGLNIPRENWEFCVALNLFKSASIAQGVFKRSLQGNASASNASAFLHFVTPIAKEGLKHLEHFDKKENEDDDNLLPSEFNMLHISTKCRQLYKQIKTFVEEQIIPAEKIFAEHVSNQSTQWKIHPYLEELKAKARKAGLWNLFLPAESGLSQLEYALLAEITGKSAIAPEVFNCGAPDTGNMEVLHLYGSAEQKEKWLTPLLNGEIRSAFCMTEPGVASSDATNMECQIRKDGEHYIVNGRKWWSSGAGDPRCKIAIVMGRCYGDNLPRHRQHSMILVPLDTPGVNKVRALTVFGYNDAPHGHLEIVFDNVRVPASNMILGEGRGFEIAQGRLGPGRLHHCMRSIGLAERSLQLLCERAIDRVAFGKRLAEKGMVQEQISLSRMEIDQARLLVLKAAYMLDTKGNKAARKEIAMAKVVVARMACQVIDRAIQVHGGMGVSQDSPLAYMYSGARSLRIADGPDEVHMEAIAKLELREHLKARL